MWNTTLRTKYFPLTAMLNHPVTSNQNSSYLKFLETKFGQSSTNANVKTES